MLKHYKLNDTWYVGDTESDIFYKVKEHLTFNQTAALVAEGKESYDTEYTFWLHEEELLNRGAERIPFKKGLVPNGCIS